ncbi:MAG: ATPase, T2SS/T4P/T4SS family, partial [Desulfobacterales bacterium]|nr:ATPase, T2SS/T4P/T4SS family [Desulfobacterales bacterium]
MSAGPRIAANQDDGSMSQIAKAIVEDDPANESLRAFALLLQAPAITDIQVVDWRTVYVKIEGKYGLPTVDGVPFKPFRSEKELIDVLNHFLAESTHHWKRIPDNPAEVLKPKTATIETRIPGGHRIHITMPPIADSVSCTIAKFQERRMTMDDIVRSRSLTPKMANFLQWAVDARLSILVTGETGSGKT